MKKLVLALVMLASVLYSQAQSIGDDLNTIRESKPNGSFDTDPKPYTYSVLQESVNSLMIYFLNDNLVCYQIVIAPQTSSSRQKWISTFNDSWVTISSTSWKFYKEDGMILKTVIDYVDGVGTVFLIREEKKEGVEN